MFLFLSQLGKWNKVLIVPSKNYNFILTITLSLPQFRYSFLCVKMSDISIVYCAISLLSITIQRAYNLWTNIKLINSTNFRCSSFQDGGSWSTQRWQDRTTSKLHMCAVWWPLYHWSWSTQFPMPRYVWKLFQWIFMTFCMNLGQNLFLLICLTKSE